MAVTTALPAPCPTLPTDGWGADVIALTGPSGAAVRLWRGPHHWLQDDGADDDPRLAARLDRALRSAADVRRPSPALWEVVVVGDGPAAAAIGRHLVLRPSLDVVLGRDPSRPAEGPTTWQTGLLAERRGARRPARWTDAHPEDAWRPGSVVVVCTASAEPDRVLARRLVRRRAEHVVVRVHQGVALVGPWVSPGVTPCLECHDHGWAAHDGGYARVLADLEQRRAVTDESSLAWAAAVVGRHLAAPHSGRRALAGRVEVSDPLFPTLRGFRVAPHPACGCGAVAHAASMI